MAIRDELLKELLPEYKKPEDLLGPNGLLKQLTGALVVDPAQHAHGHRAVGPDDGGGTAAAGTRTAPA